MSSLFGQSVAVISPHLDDAVLSLGAALCEAATAGTDVAVVTVLAGDPAESCAPTRWDRSAGFRTAGEAAQRRRQEDARACELIGARPVWLPFPYGENRGGENRGGLDEDAIWEAVSGVTGNAEAVLLPGFPLTNPDHAWLASLLLRHRLPNQRIGLYLEQPYVRWRKIEQPYVPEGLERFVGGQLAWKAIEADGAARRLKRRACHAYASQVRLLRPRQLSLPLEWRVALYEARAGGETIAWLEDR